ncbi:MAG: hypothetical protein Q4D96_12480 [Propionibacteriaceae bacterium]|nr:hypothetical protein [Propionibacteriaceae bacterium]
MNIPFVIAGVLLLAACAIHTVAGDKEQRRLRPAADGDHFNHWLTGRCVFHIASIDLLVQGAVIVLLGIGVIPYSWPLVALLLTLHVGYLVAWVATLLVSRARKRDHARQLQWVMFLTVALLLIAGTAIWA